MNTHHDADINNDLPPDDDPIRSLISGYLDGELDAENRARVERLIEEDASFREEFERMRQLITATSSAVVAQPPEEVWNVFMEGVYNRIERRTGWVVVIIGVLALTILGIYTFLTVPWGSWWLKLLIATPVLGLVILFASVLRERRLVAKTDRYSREVNW